MRATGYYTHALCAKHDMGEGHPECPQRLGAIWDRLLATGVADALRVHEAPAADQPDLRRAHDGLLLSSLEALCQQVADGREAGGPAHLAIDADTAVNAYTWQAALRAAGAVVAATDAVLDGQLEKRLLRGPTARSPRLPLASHGLLRHQQRRGGGAARA